MILSLLLTVAAVAVALRLRPRAPQAPSQPWLAMVIAFVITTVYHLAQYDLPGYLPAFGTTLILIGLLAVGVASAVRWRLDPLRLAVGAVLPTGGSG